MLYGWKENSMLTNCLAACAHLTITVSEIERDIGRKSSFYHTPLHSTPSLGGSRRSSATPFGMEKLEWLGYPMVKKISEISLFVLAQLTNVTDGRTDRHRMPAIAALTQHRTAKTCNIHSLLLRSKIRNPYRWDAQCQQGIAVNLQPYTHLFRARHKVLCSDTQNVQW